MYKILSFSQQTNVCVMVHFLGQEVSDRPLNLVTVAYSHPFVILPDGKELAVALISDKFLTKDRVLHYMERFVFEEYSELDQDEIETEIVLCSYYCAPDLQERFLSLSESLPMENL